MSLDFEAWDQAQRTVWPIVSSPMAVRLYAVATVVIVLGLSLRLAYRQHEQLAGLEESLFEPKFRGRKPERRVAIERRQKLIAQIRRDQWALVLRNLTTLFLLGVALPTALLMAITIIYPWFGTGGIPLQFLNSQTPDPRPTIPEVLSFVGSQLLRGVIIDFIDVFKLQTSAVTNNPTEYPF